MIKRNLFFSILICILGCSFIAVLLAEVNVDPYGGPNTETFPPESPPSDLAGGESADAAGSASGSGGKFTGPYDSDTSEFTVGTLGDITVSGRTDIREPSDASDVLHNHEVGHHELYEYEYNKHAKEKFEKAFEGFVGMKFKGEGATPEARYNNALDKAEAERDKRLDTAAKALKEQMQEIADKFDNLTDHGRKTDPNTTKGIAEAIAERERAMQAGSVPADANQDANSTSQSSMSVDFDGQYMIFAGPSLITNTGSASDPIFNRGEVSIDNIIPIGLQDDRTILLSDTHIDINDTVTGQTLLNGHVYELAYMESTRTGYAGMIQGYLDIPPASANGTNNVIGSPFLTDIQTACDNNEQTTFWYFANQPLFDENGQCIIPVEGVNGTVVLGVAIPANRSTVDDFENYAALPDLQANWIHYGNAGLGLVSGEPVNGGQRAMMINFNNTAPPFFSEAVYQYSSPQNWQDSGARSLELWVNDSQAGNVIGQMYVAVEDFSGTRHMYEVSGEVDSYVGISGAKVVPENGYWWSVNIDLAEFESNGVVLSQIT